MMVMMMMMMMMMMIPLLSSLPVCRELPVSLAGGGGGVLSLAVTDAWLLYEAPNHSVCGRGGG
jgi:hypothetical protein